MTTAPGVPEILSSRTLVGALNATSKITAAAAWVTQRGMWFTWGRVGPG